MTEQIVRLTARDAPMPLAPPPPGAGAVIFTLPAGEYSLKPQPDGTVQVCVHASPVTTGDRAAPISASEMNQKNREFWRTRQCR